jgi:hypothetical protein
MDTADTPNLSNHSTYLPLNLSTMHTNKISPCNEHVKMIFYLTKQHVFGFKVKGSLHIKNHVF